MSQIQMRRARGTPAAFELLREQDVDAWATMKRLQALPMVPLPKLEEAAKYTFKKAPKAFRTIVKDFTDFYIRGKKTVSKKGVEKYKEPT